MVNKNVLSCFLKDGKEVNAMMLVGRLFHARATVTRNDRSPMVLSINYYLVCSHVRVKMTVGLYIAHVWSVDFIDAN